MKKKQPKTLYLVYMNLGGALHPEIYTMHYNEEDDVYWDKMGYYDFNLKTSDSHGCYFSERSRGRCSFAFSKKSDAELFKNGALEFQKFATGLLTGFSVYGEE